MQIMRYATFSIINFVMNYKISNEFNIVKYRYSILQLFYAMFLIGSVEIKIIRTKNLCKYIHHESLNLINVGNASLKNKRSFIILIGQVPTKHDRIGEYPINFQQD